jgi:hypothetical protein
VPSNDGIRGGEGREDAVSVASALVTSGRGRGREQREREPAGSVGTRARSTWVGGPDRWWVGDCREIGGARLEEVFSDLYSR